jgi:eukaryotic-like serine/threonine-protein kinase
MRTVSQETTPGAVMGTVGYMSPEQVRGQPADPPSDIFAFGAVLFEMLTGNRAFHGATSADTMSAILNQDPPISQLVASQPSGLQRVISHCLQKDPEQRFHSAADLAFALQSLPDLSGMNVATARGKPSWPLRMSARARLISIPSAVAVVPLLATAGYFYFHRTPKLTPKDTIVLADFVNATGDPVFDDTLKQAMSIQLEQSPFLRLLPDQSVRQTLKLMGRPANEKLTQDIAMEVCLRSNGKAVLTGSIAAIGSHYSLDLKALNCQSGDTLASVQAEADSREKVLHALGGAGDQLRAKMGESLASVERDNKPLEEATTNSLEALRAYTQGRLIQWEQGTAEALPYYRRAIELDPNFARAYAALGSMYTTVGQYDLAVENYKKAYDLRDKVSERERFYIETVYYSFVTGELDKAIETYRQWIQVYPADATAHGNLGVAYLTLGRHEKAVIEAEASVRLSPSGIGYGNLMNDYLTLDRWAEARDAFRQARALNVDSWPLHSSRYDLAFLEGDSATMQEEGHWALSQPGSENAMFARQSETEAYYGRLSKAREFTQRAVDSAKYADLKEAEAQAMLSGALHEAEFGAVADARRIAANALAITSTRSVRAVAAFVFARAGDATQANKLTSQLNDESPRDLMMQSYWLPAVRAALELRHGDANKVIEGLQVTTLYELGSPSWASVERNPTMYPTLLRGEAYLRLGRGQEAQAEFQRIIEHRGFVLNSFTGALAHLELARAYAMSGDSGKARVAYQVFLTLWKDADPYIPILVEAKAEYAKLH